MSAWNQNELQKIEDTDDLHVAPFRDDGVTPGTPTWIWSVVVDGKLYARAYNGTASRWYKAAIRQKAGRITAAGTERDVSFARTGEDLTAPIDAAYKAKYADSPYLASMISAKAQAATVVILPAAR